MHCAAVGEQFTRSGDDLRSPNLEQPKCEEGSDVVDVYKVAYSGSDDAQVELPTHYDLLKAFPDQSGCFQRDFWAKFAEHSFSVPSSDQIEVTMAEQCSGLTPETLPAPPTIGGAKLLAMGTRPERLFAVSPDQGAVLEEYRVRGVTENVAPTYVSAVDDDSIMFTADSVFTDGPSRTVVAHISGLSKLHGGGGLFAQPHISSWFTVYREALGGVLYSVGYSVTNNMTYGVVDRSLDQWALVALDRSLPQNFTTVCEFQASVNLMEDTLSVFPSGTDRVYILAPDALITIGLDMPTNGTVLRHTVLAPPAIMYGATLDETQQRIVGVRETGSLAVINVGSGSGAFGAGNGRAVCPVPQQSGLCDPISDLATCVVRQDTFSCSLRDIFVQTSLGESSSTAINQQTELYYYTGRLWLTTFEVQ
jgi:hypothetical protein